MQLTRRSFNLSLLLSVAATALRPLPAQASVDPDTVLLNRLTFGASSTDRARLADIGPTAWLDEQLAMPANPPDMLARISAMRFRMEYEADDDGEGHSWPAVNELRAYTYLNGDPVDVLPLLDWEVPMSYAERSRPGEEVVAMSLPRAVHTPAQVREVMTQFWHDHFNVHSQKNEFVAAFFPSYDAMMRDRALGNFRDLLDGVAKSPSMLFYLNNDESRASPANENFARELLELHTLGAGNYLNETYPHWADVPGAIDGLAQGYIDQDVFEVARAFTGWTVGDGRYVAEGVNAPKTGVFHYIEGWHDPYQKRILGREFPPNRAAMADGDDVLDMLATHPRTAAFVCEKIARRLLTDTPDAALIDRLAQTFLAQSDSPDQIAHVVRALVNDPAFAAPATKLRRPFEFLTGLLRASGVKVAPTDTGFAWHLSRAGWLQHTFPPPTGHPDTAEDWMSSTVILRMVDLALFAHDPTFGITTTSLSGGLPDTVKTIGELADFWANSLQGQVGDGLPEFLTHIEINPADDLPQDAVERHDLSVAMLAFAALSPQFFYR